MVLYCLVWRWLWVMLNSIEFLAVLISKLLESNYAIVSYLLSLLFLTHMELCNKSCFYSGCVGWVKKNILCIFVSAFDDAALLSVMKTGMNNWVSSENTCALRISPMLACEDAFACNCVRWHVYAGVCTHMHTHAHMCMNALRHMLISPYTHTHTHTQFYI